MGGFLPWLRVEVVVEQLRGAVAKMTVASSATVLSGVIGVMTMLGRAANMVR